MQVFHTRAAVSSAFDDPNLVSVAGLVPVMGLAADTGLGDLVDEHVKVPEYYGANAGLKVSALVAGMAAGADCIDDMGILRHGATGKLFKGTYAPSTLGSFLRRFTFGHVRQLEAAAARWLVSLTSATPHTPPSTTSRCRQKSSTIWHESAPDLTFRRKRRRRELPAVVVFST